MGMNKMLQFSSNSFRLKVCEKHEFGLWTQSRNESSIQCDGVK